MVAYAAGFGHRVRSLGTVKMAASNNETEGAFLLLGGAAQRLVQQLLTDAAMLLRYVVQF